MKTIKDFSYISRADMSTDIRDTLELVNYLTHLEHRIMEMEARIRGREFVSSLGIKPKDSPKGENQ